MHPTIIDNIFSNGLESDTISDSLLSQISDHFPQFLVIKNTTVDYKHCTLFQHDYFRFAESSFINDFTGLSWNFLNETNLNINSKFDTLYEKAHETAIKHVPLKKVTPKQLNLRSKPWIDSHIQKLIKHWDRLLRISLGKLIVILLKNYTRNLETELLVKIVKVKSSILMITFNPTNLL